MAKSGEKWGKVEKVGEKWGKSGEQLEKVGKSWKKWGKVGISGEKWEKVGEKRHFSPFQVDTQLLFLFLFFQNGHQRPF